MATMVDICGADPDPMQQELARLRNGCWVSDYVSCTAIQIIISLLVQLQVFYQYNLCNTGYWHLLRLTCSGNKGTDIIIIKAAVIHV